MKTGRIILITIVVIVVGFVIYLLINPEKILQALGPDIQEVYFTKALDSNKNGLDEMVIIFRNKLIPVSLDSLFMEVALEENNVAKIAKRDTIKIKPYTVDTIILPASIDYKQIFKTIRSANEENKDSLELSFKGTVFYNFPIIGNTRIPVDKQFSFRAPDPPEITLEKIKVTRLDLPKIDIVATIKIKNNESINLVINSMKYSFLIGDSVVVSKGSKRTSITIEGEKSTTTDIPIETNLNVIDNIIIQILKNGGKLPVTLNNEIEVSTNYEMLKNLIMDIEVKDTVTILK